MPAFYVREMVAAHHSQAPEVRQILPELKYLRHVVVVGLEQDGEQETATLHDFEKWALKAPAKLEAAETNKDDSAYWLYSSGSTGFPKGCVHLQHDTTYCLEYYAKPILGIKETDITLSAAKLFFAYGLGNNLTFPFGVGASAVHYPGRPLAEDMFKAIEQYRQALRLEADHYWAHLQLGSSYLALGQVAEAELDVQ